MGIDYYKVTPTTNSTTASQCLVIASLILQVALTTVKISVLLLYKRIFTTRKFKIACWAAIALLSSWGILFFFLLVFQAVPFSAIWTGKGRYLLPTTKVGPAQAITSLILDVIVLTFPIPILARLHMPTTRKVAVGFILWLGAFCVVAATCRLVLLVKSYSAVFRARETGSVDIHSIFAPAYIFLIIEPNCSIIAASLPCLGPFFSEKNRPGRALESVVRSARSVISIMSSGSSGRSNDSRGSSQQQYNQPEQTDVNGVKRPIITSKTGVSVVNVEEGNKSMWSENIEMSRRDEGSIEDSDSITIAETNIAMQR